jgi:hypothetical protein
VLLPHPGIRSAPAADFFLGGPGDTKIHTKMH